MPDATRDARRARMVHQSWIDDAAGAAAPAHSRCRRPLRRPRHRRPPLRDRRGTGRCARARRDTASASGAYGRSNNFLRCSLESLHALVSRPQSHDLRQHFTSRKSAVYSPHGTRQRASVSEKPVTSPRYVALNRRECLARDRGFSECGRRSGMAPPAYFFLRFSERDLLVDVGAAYPLRRVEVGAAVLFLELLRGPRCDHRVLALAGLHQLRDAIAHHHEHVVERLQLGLVAERPVAANEPRVVVDASRAPARARGSGHRACRRCCRR